MKKEGWGGGGSRVVVFQRGQGDEAQLKPGVDADDVSNGPTTSPNAVPFSWAEQMDSEDLYAQ